MGLLCTVSLTFGHKHCYNILWVCLTTDTKKVYGTVADKEDNLVRKDGGPFSEKDFFQNPGEYKSVFFEKVHCNLS